MERLIKKKKTENFFFFNLENFFIFYEAELLRQIIEKFSMDQALIFVRTRLDGDNLAKYFKSLGGKTMKRTK